MQDVSISNDQPLNVSDHFAVQGAFTMPRLQYNTSSRTFVKQVHGRRSILTNPERAIDLHRNRFNIIKQRLLRNERFGHGSIHMLNPDAFLKITPTMSLIGRDNQDFLLFGMLTEPEHGKHFLEDETGRMELDLSNTNYRYGLFTLNAFVLVDGLYGDDHIFHVRDIEFPAAESRAMTESVFPHIDFLGLTKPLVDPQILQIEETANTDACIVFISEMDLQEPKTMRGLRLIFESFKDTRPPIAFVLMGNFTKQRLFGKPVRKRQYRDGFTMLADLINKFPVIAEESTFVLVPGAMDAREDAVHDDNTITPREKIPDNYTNRFRHRVRKAIFTTNPCRIRYCTQDIVVYREDLFSELWRNSIVRPRASEGESLAEHLVRTVLDQGTLCPLPQSVKPVYTEYEQALQLYPLPDVLVLADKVDAYGINYQETHCLNPGSFSKVRISWSTYYPATRTSENKSMRI
ncbi:DNA polymerase alpha/epsilon subunit B-domain-containing protein [Syncephalastrum racemosum]|uniref:DNA polymerase epsilon subunit B n=1 Tax=Syncephalastrum racemosum TaxID=13706 RepID=A0A1X2H1F4_SYNRA|nr:DNA polymerase alpha/epsilon subunit B-domain-containing protein [Syncephalastrum racemosum]